MAILTGRHGRIAYVAPGIAGSPEAADEIISLNAWTLDAKTDFEEVTCFGDSNKIWIPGLKDSSGTVAGFWNSADRTLFTAADASTPGYLMLSPNTQDGSGTPIDAPYWAGLAYMDASINCSLAAPKISGTWKAAGTFALGTTFA